MFNIKNSIESVINNHTSFDNYTKIELIKKIKVRFQYFVDISKSFVVEEYIENEWRDSFDLYYSKTNYKNCNNLVKRIHFIKNEIDDLKKITEENYVGYINIRPIPKGQISRIRFKFTSLAFGEYFNEDIYCLSIDTTVNLPHISISYPSFPLYSQDGMVSICAHADLLMISKYMYKRYNFNNYKLKDIIENNIIANDNGRKIPSEGLNLLQILSILKANNYNPISTRFINGFYNRIDIFNYIDSFLESGLPVILAFNSHVVLVIGHMNNSKKHYVIADDSSYHVSKSFKKVESHVAIISQEELKEKFNDCSVFVISPTFDRFYLHYQHLELIINHQIEKLERQYNSLAELNGNNIKIKTREILVESCLLKQFLYKCGDNTFESVMMPHYVWYVEFYLNKVEKSNLAHYLIIDASAHKSDRRFSIINDINDTSVSFVNTKMKNKMQLSRLKKLEQI
ncbi:hypothetical protein O8C83_11180 [Aliarcobacter butzleri]|uniref:hypothetical protein n=1 Tax=Aliarcobacter butzleri TaxID=28197 RepID=UPI00263EB97A|nr:hypothetical protein [Aliarcobacter butzleri]MDN5101380.1 hypothetical protein [Aliarcobacter butzleri]